MPGEVVIRAKELTKRYATTLAVDHVDFEVRSGEIVGILGPNGSGKTTTIRAGSAGGLSESANFRITVLTSTVWGAVGIGVIAAALLVVVFAVARFGRR